MAVEIWANNARSSLDSAIDDSQTTLNVVSGQGQRFPNPTAGDWFFATIDNGSNVEIIKVTTRATDSFSVIVRAQQGTTARAWNAGTRIENRITKETLEDLQNAVPGSGDIATDTIWDAKGDLAVGTGSNTSARLAVGSNGQMLFADSTQSTGIKWDTAPSGGSGDSSLTSAYGSRPAASNDGNLFLPSDGFVLERDTGSGYVPWGPIFPFTAPIDGDFAWINQGGATISTTNGCISMTIPADASRNIRIRKKTAPSPPYTITAWFIVSVFPNVTNASLLFGFRQSSDGKLANFTIVPGTIISQKNTDATTFSANYTTAAYNSEYTLSLICLRIADNNTNRILSLSNDGINFIPFHSTGRTDFLTANEIFWGGDSESASAGLAITLLSWKEA